MKLRDNHDLTIATVSAWWLTNFARAFHYGRAAQCDERDGFPHTAALEWHKAAELLAPNTRAADYCWRQWERIMQLPRRLAVVGVSQAEAFPLQLSSASSAIDSVVGQISFANAA